jgi:ABC-type uncharacterized transport system ATPase subunit
VALAVEAAGLTKVFRTREKAAGLKASLSGLVAPRFRDVEAVAGIDLRIEPGELLAFIGPNDAGKSTTIKMLTGILYPTSGSAVVLGLVPWRDRRDHSEGNLRNHDRTDLRSGWRIHSQRSGSTTSFSSPSAACSYPWSFFPTG